MSSSPLNCWLPRYWCGRNRKSRRAAKALRIERLESREVPAVFVPSDISGRVFVDCNDNGVFDIGEEGIAGVTIALTGTDFFNQPVTSITTTAADGTYSFTKLEPGKYNLAETQPAGFFDGKDQLGFVVGAPASDNGTAGNDTFTNIFLEGGDSHARDYNFGELLHNNLSGTVYFDANDNGVQDSGETGIAGATLALTGTNDLGQAINQTITSSANGSYSFTDLRPGNYSITETTPPGFIDGKDTVGTTNGVTNGQLSPPDSIVNISLDGCHSGIGYDFGEKKQAAVHTLGGFVYQDCNNNGVFDDGEPPIANVVITLTGADVNGASVSLTATTDVHGQYQFANLNAGTYTLTEQQPAGFLDGKDAAGTPFGGAASTTIGQDIISGITIPTSPTTLHGVNYNFGEVGTSISGIIYEDTNDNGVRDVGEPLITVPVTITLTGTDDIGQAVSRTIVTTTGQYQFNLIRPGAYAISESQPAGYEDGKDSVGQTDGALNGQLSPPDSIVNISLDGCHAGTGYNFGEKKIAALNTLSGFVYQDCNNNGVFDAGDQPIANAVVNLTGTDTTGAAVNLTATTNASGQYQFIDLKAGTYTLTEQQPAGFLDARDTAGTPFGGAASTIIGQDVISAITIPTSSTPQNGVNYNFGEVGTSISGIIYEDTNDNGVRDAGEPLITVPVTIALTGTDDTGASVSRTVVTTTGQYQFDLIRPGTYTISESQPAGYDDGKDTVGQTNGVTNGQLSPPDSIVNISLDGCHAGTGYNFGEKKQQPTLNTISGFVFEDCNNNGTFDAGEEPIANVVINLTGVDTSGANVNLTAKTNPSGAYQFTNLKAGVYTLTEQQPAGFLDGKDAAGTPFGGIASPTIGQDVISAINIPSSTTPQNGINYNFGEVGASIAGVIYEDTNNNGVRDAGEDLITQTVTITLTGTDDIGNSVSRTVVTTSGQYQFNLLRPGIYALSESQPAGFTDGIDTPGTPFGGTAQEPDRIININVDGCHAGTGYNFGEQCPPSSLSGFVYFDTGAGTPGSPGYNDGIRQDTEVQISGVTITLTGVDDLGNSVSLTTTTGQVPGQGNGFYQFTNLREGTYVISETQPSAGGQLLPDGKDTPGTPTGSNALINDKISNIVLPCGFNGVNNNFGELGNQSAPGNATISGMVYVDWNCNGIQDAIDTTGIAGVTITLVNTDTGATIGQTTTDKNGRYSFVDLTTGNYTLIETQPPNFLDSGENAGTPFGGDTSVNDQIRDIQIPIIPDNTTLNGINYNFGECNNPTKRNFLASHTT